MTNLTFLFQTILLGDSGVGKTSLLVKFDTGKFQTGNFSATVGIGFTVSTKKHYKYKYFYIIKLLNLTIIILNKSIKWLQ